MKILKISLVISTLLLFSCAELDALDIERYTVDDMSDSRLCELLDSDLVRSSRERGYIKEELNYRNLSCKEGIAVSTKTDDSVQTNPKPSGPRTVFLDGAELTETEEFTFDTWKCSTLLNAENVVVEVGVIRPTDMSKSSTNGFVLYDGENTGRRTMYSREGLARWWVWGEDNVYQITLETSGSAYYYDFSRAGKGEKIKPSEAFFCKKV